MAKKQDIEQPQQTMEDFLLQQLDAPVMIKDLETGEMRAAANPDGSVMTKQQAIATNILNQAMKGDLKAAQYIQNIQLRSKRKK